MLICLLNDIHLLFPVHFGMLFTNNPDASDVSLLIIRYLDNHSRDGNLTEAVTKHINKKLLYAEIDRLCEQNEDEEAYALYQSGEPINGLEITEWIQANGFHRVLGKFKNKDIRVMVPYEPLDIKAIQLAVEGTEFKSSVNEIANNHAGDSEWNACPTMHIADLHEKYAYELCTFNLKEL